jgi:hypothetical protein
VSAFPWARLLLVLFLAALFLAWAVVYAASRRRGRSEQRGFEVRPPGDE